MKRLSSVPGALMLLLMLANLPMLAQSTVGSLSGLISDPNGAALVGAKVTLKNPATNAEFRTNTNAQGTFVFPQLVPGRYSASVEATGFKKVDVTGIVV